jgi:class 3 adenylate cyclase
MSDLMKKCWSKDAGFRPQAKELDMALMDMSPNDAEPLMTEQQRNEKKRSGDMLYDLFPRHVADALKAGQKVEAENHELVTVVFSDIVHFTDISRELSPMKVSQMLDRLYLAFDKIARAHIIFKVETIGDAYMGVTNLLGDMDNTHVKHAAEFAIDMINEAGKILIDDEDPHKGFIQIRVGFHSGPVVSNVIGSLNPRYGLFGDTVNTASRMESNSRSQKILCSERSYRLLKEQAPEIPVAKRGAINVKGKGEMKVYWVGGDLVVAGQEDKQHGDAGASQQGGKRVGFEVEDE